MSDWRILDAKRRGALVATTLSRAWYGAPPPLELSAAELARIAPVLLDSPAAALVWNKLRTTSAEQLLLDQFRDAYRISTLQSEVRAVDLRAVLAKLRSADVDPIVHKGWATARLYPDPGMRSYSDIDLLIRTDQLAATQAALKSLGPVQCPIDLMHSELAELDAVSWDARYGRSRLVKLESQEVRILGAEDHLRSLCIHCLKHGVASPLWLADVAVTLESVADNFDWDLCIGPGRPQSNWVRSALSLAHRLLAADIRGTPIVDFVHRLPGWLTRSVLRRWSRPPVPAPVPRLASVLKRREGLLEALAGRWPSAGQTTVDANAMFTRIPNIHLQLQSLLAPAKVKIFVSQLPSVWRDTK